MPGEQEQRLEEWERRPEAGMQEELRVFEVQRPVALAVSGWEG